MKGGRYQGAALAALVLAGVGSVRAQTVDRSTTITGPRGNSVTRNIQTQRGPGFIDRNVQITRPGGATFDRNTLIRRGPGPGGRFFPGGGFGPRIIENNYVVGGGGPGWGTALGIGGGLFGLGLLTGGALATPPPPPPPPPVYVAPPGVVAAPPAAAYPPPMQYAQRPPAGADPVLDAVGRLSSMHDNSRREGCYTLGRLGDPRAANPLIDRLKNDNNRDVRVAAAWALGEIGDPRTGVYLERAATYDKKREVRDAAALAMGRLPRATSPPQQASAPSSINVPRLSPPASLPTSRPTEPNLLPLPESDSAPPPPPSGSAPPPLPQRPTTGYSDRP